MILRLLLLVTLFPMLCSAQSDNYLDYHREITKAEELIVNKQFRESLTIYRNLSDHYQYIFLRDCKVAAQVSSYINDIDNVFHFLEKGMKKGWTLKEIKKNEHLNKFKSDERWKNLKNNEDQYIKEFYQSINLELRAEIKEMLSEDQKRALRVALTPVKKWKENYTNRKFVPNNRAQVRRINAILDQTGYPGEKIIGDKSWATVILSHNEHDTIYTELRPKLYRAFERGELSAIDLAMIESWRTAVNTGWKDKSFVIWKEKINSAQAAHADSLRQTIGLRSVELNNKLLLAAKELKMNFYLSPFHGGLITIKE